MPGNQEPNILNAVIHQGKKLSYNNIMDADGALACVREFEETACVVVKHANPCGVAVGNDLLDVYDRAFNADSLSALLILARLEDDTHFGVPSPGSSLAQVPPVLTFTQPGLPSLDLDPLNH